MLLTSSRALPVMLLLLVLSELLTASANTGSSHMAVLHCTELPGSSMQSHLSTPGLDGLLGLYLHIKVVQAQVVSGF